MTNTPRDIVADRAENLEVAAILMDGFDDAIIGTIVVDDKLRVVYSYLKMVDVLMVRDKMTDSEAMEFIDYNCQMSFDNCPLIVDDIDLF
jgi:hypothetical protein